MSSKQQFVKVSAKVAAAIDQELMGSYGFSIDQLMELAGQAVSHCAYNVHPPSKGSKVLVLVGPGNNGGDGLVASRHLKLMGYDPTIYCPKRSSGEIFSRLHTQLEHMQIPYTTDLDSSFSSTDLIIDSLFGFSFKPPVRESFVPVMNLLTATTKPVISVDVPSGWDVDEGPKGSHFHPSVLISLTAPKQCTEHFRGRHFVGGRFIDNAFAKQYGFEVPPYKKTDQVYEYI